MTSASVKCAFNNPDYVSIKTPRSEWQIQQRNEILALLSRHAKDKDMFEPLEDDARMWFDTFELGACNHKELRGFSYGLTDPLEDWMQIGYGRDRDIGSRLWFVNLWTGKLARYFYADGWGASLTLMDCSIQELDDLYGIYKEIKEHHCLGVYNLKKFISRKCSFALKFIEPSKKHLDKDGDQKTKEKNETQQIVTDPLSLSTDTKQVKQKLRKERKQKAALASSSLSGQEQQSGVQVFNRFDVLSNA